MEIETNPQIALLDEVKIQAKVLVPLLNALRAELGEDRANTLTRNALRDQCRDKHLRLGENMPGTPVEKWQAINEHFGPRIGTDIDQDVLRQKPDAVEFNIIGCRYADFFHALDEPELGAILLCEADDHIVEVGSPDVELKRTQTIMMGAKYCDFRYHIKAVQESESKAD